MTLLTNTLYSLPSSSCGTFTTLQTGAADEEQLQKLWHCLQNIISFKFLSTVDRSVARFFSGFICIPGKPIIKNI